MRARSSVGDWYTPRPTSLSVESREPSDPETAANLDSIRPGTLKVLKELSFPVVTDPEQASLQMTFDQGPSRPLWHVPLSERTVRLPPYA